MIGGVGGLARKGLVAWLAWCAGATAACAGAATASALTIAVPAGVADSGAGCGASPCPNLRAAVALANANPGSTIVLEAGGYPLTLGQLTITASVSIVGAGPAATRIVQLNPARVIELATATAPSLTLEGLEITGGNFTKPTEGSNAEGGGVASFSKGTLTLQDVLVDHNGVRGVDGPPVTGSTMGIQGGEGHGGGVAALGPLLLDHVSVLDNTAIGGNGGAAENGHGSFGGGSDGAGVEAEGPLTIRDSTISGNVGVGGRGGTANTLAGSGGEAFGGGVDSNVFAASLIERTTIAGNSATGGGGGAAMSLGGFGGAGAGGFGGGLFLRDGVLENSTVTANSTHSGPPGSGIPPGTSGEAVSPFGGGLYVNAMVGLTLASDTFLGNVSDPADFGNGGNIAVNSGAPLTMSDTIVAGGSAAFGANCSGKVIDGGHNLQDTVGAECELSAAAADLIGASPLLGSLAENGGPTQTLALGASSPALAAGDACTDPSAGGAPLTIDQRGLARAAVCDIGAFEHEPPASSAAPAVEGTPAAGQTLTCARGGWSGDAPLTFSYRWLRDGVLIAAATSSTYAISAADAGHLLACQVSAQNIYASSTATSAAVAVPASPASQPAPTITAVRESHAVWREGTRLAAIARTRRARTPVGTAVQFTLNTAASVTLAFTQTASGRTVGARCVKATRRNRRRHRCRLTVTVGAIAFPGAHAGVDTIAFQGRLTSTARLRPGRYAILLTASDPAGRAQARGPSFTILAH